MKLLIVDDEKLTREGIISSIDWDSLGISEIYQSNDGIHGLELSKIIQPDIILSDVRMPRMDGIEMASRLKELFPNISIIFMSGYSDKEYLKAAIRLKAISYVEKPLDPEEIKEAVLDALKTKQQIDENSDTKKEHRRFASSSLATKLIYPSARTNTAIAADFEKLNLHITETTVFHTLIFSFKHPISQVPENTLNSFYIQFHNMLENYSLSEIHGVKQERFLICHVFGCSLSMELLKILVFSASKMASVLGNDFFVVIGKKVLGASQIYDSYNSAVILLQSSFYYPYGSWFIYGISDSHISSISALPVSMDEFRDLLNQRNPKAMEIAKAIYETLSLNKNVMPNQVKNLYYQMFSAIQESYLTLQIPITEQRMRSANSLEQVFHCETIFELNQLLVQELNLFFSQADLSSEESSPVTAIKNFIASHYHNESLSIKDISDHVFLSTSYICTLFKMETGLTLNQYITKYRIEKAKKLLADPRNKVSDISSKVGYSDGNYFGKTFKKIVGLSPTEYREQELNS